jgi:hypothetical protein
VNILQFVLLFPFLFRFFGSLVAFLSADFVDLAVLRDFREREHKV